MNEESDQFSERVYLGSYQNKDYFCTQIKDKSFFDAMGTFVDARPHLFELPEFDQTLLRQALGLMDFSIRYG
jgi:hypothetical protein